MGKRTLDQTEGVPNFRILRLAGRSFVQDRSSFRKLLQVEKCDRFIQSRSVKVGIDGVCFLEFFERGLFLLAVGRCFTKVPGVLLKNISSNACRAVCAAGLCCAAAPLAEIAVKVIERKILRIVDSSALSVAYPEAIIQLLR